MAAFLHPTFGAHKLYGLYEPGPGIGERHVAPLLDPNNLAGYLNVSLCFALAAALAPDPRIPRPIAGAVVLLLVATQVWVASRAGVTCMILGTIVVIAIRWYARSREQRLGGTVLSLVTGGVAVAGVVLIVLASSNEASGELLDDDVSKLQMFQRVMRMLPAVPFFGCGRGAFEERVPGVSHGLRVRSLHAPRRTSVRPMDPRVGTSGLRRGLRSAGVRTTADRDVREVDDSGRGLGQGWWRWRFRTSATWEREIPGLLLAGVVCSAVVVGGTPGRAAQWRGARWAGHPRIIVIAGGAVAAFAMIAVGGGIGRGGSRRTVAVCTTLRLSPASLWMRCATRFARRCCAIPRNHIFRLRWDCASFDTRMKMRFLGLGRRSSVRRSTVLPTSSSLARSPPARPHKRAWSTASPRSRAPEQSPYRAG